MRSDHNKLQITANLSIGEQILGCLELELVYKYTSQVTFLFLPNAWVFRNSFYFSIQRILFRTSTSSLLFSQTTLTGKFS